MKKYTVFESSIIGLFIGVVVSTYLVFLNSSGAYVGKILAWVSQMPVLDSLKISTDGALFIPFIFVVAVYTLYGLLIGLIIKFSAKTKYIAGFATVLIFGIIIEQYIGGPVQQKTRDSIPYVAAVVRAIPVKTPEQYFGNETKGDLNGDGVDDVVFIISRDDKSRGALYYLTAALKIESGHSGTNLIYLGDKIEPVKVSIMDGNIIVDYLNHALKNATTTKQMYMKVMNGQIKTVKSIVK